MKVVRALLSMTLEWENREVLKIPLSMYLYNVEHGTKEWEDELMYIIRTAEMLTYMCGMNKVGALLTVTGDTKVGRIDISKYIDTNALYGDSDTMVYTRERCYLDLNHYVGGETFLRVMDYDAEREREYNLVSAIFGKTVVDTAIAEEIGANVTYNK